MAETQRVKVKKIYVWRFTLFGLVFGLFLGLLLAGIFLLLSITISSIGLEGATLFGIEISKVFVGITALISILLFSFSLFFSVVFSFFSAIVYNLFSLMGIKIHLLFEEFEEENKDKII